MGQRWPSGFFMALAGWLMAPIGQAIAAGGDAAMPYQQGLRALLSHLFPVIGAGGPIIAEFGAAARNRDLDLLVASSPCSLSLRERGE